MSEIIERIIVVFLSDLLLINAMLNRPKTPKGKYVGAFTKSEETHCICKYKNETGLLSVHEQCTQVEGNDSNVWTGGFAGQF